MNTSYPIFDASPDGLIECECCGLGCLEIKCPITLTRGKLNDLPYLTVGTIGSLSGVATSTKCTGRQFCDFVVWGPGVLHVERIFSDVAVIETTEIAIMFHAKCVMQELCVKYFISKYVENTVAVNSTLLSLGETPVKLHSLALSSKRMKRQEKTSVNYNNIKTPV